MGLKVLFDQILIYITEVSLFYHKKTTTVIGILKSSKL